MDKLYDVIIIGSGVVGNAIAREMSRYNLKIGVLEKELDVCNETSARNSGYFMLDLITSLGHLWLNLC
ncbi:MAG: FAD-dependent oxidoreductase [Intestinibacter sp.]